MSKFQNSVLIALLAGGGLVGCKDGNAAVGPLGKNAGAGASMAETGAPTSKSTLLGRATFAPTGSDGKLDIKRRTDDWSIDIKSRPAVDIAVQKIVFPVGSASGWHTHPGPVFIQVVYGTMTFYQEDDPICSPIIRTAGQGYLDLGLHPHIAVNESADSVVNIVTYFAPPGAALKMAATTPPNCAGVNAAAMQMP